MISHSVREAMPIVKPNANIAILGGSFDPPHICHQLLALSILAIEPIDTLWVIPCADHPFQKNLSNFDHRFEMCKLAFSRFDKDVHVVPLEKYLPTPNYTVKTLKSIKSVYPDCQLFLTMGSDIIADIAQWHEPQELSLLSKIIVFLRAGFPFDQVPKELNNFRLHKSFVLPDLRSTFVRAQLKTALQDETANTLLDQKVLKYIKQHNLYNQT